MGGGAPGMAGGQREKGGAEITPLAVSSLVAMFSTTCVWNIECRFGVECCFHTKKGSMT